MPHRSPGRARALRGVGALMAAATLSACAGNSHSPGAAGYPAATTAAYASGGATAAPAAMPASEASVMDAPSAAMAAPAPVAPGFAGGGASPAARASMGIAVAHPASSSDASNGATRAETRAADAQQAPMLIYTAAVSMVSPAVPEAIDRAINVAVASGGHLALRSDTSVQVRVPSAHFREVLAQLEALGEVTHREVQAEDVSEQFHDLEVQLANLRAVRARLTEFLARAANVNDALTVERELERVGAQIDQIEGRMRFLASRAAFSTITLSLTRAVPVVLGPPPPPPPPPLPPEVSLPVGWLQSLGLSHLLQLQIH